MRQSLSRLHLLHVQGAVGVAISTLLIFLSGSVMASEPHVEPYSMTAVERLSSGQLSESLFPVTYPRSGGSGIGTPVQSAWLMPLASHSPNYPVWLTGSIEVGPGRVLTPQGTRWFQATRSILDFPDLKTLDKKTHPYVVQAGRQTDATSEFDFTLDRACPDHKLSLLERIGSDHRHFYSLDSMVGLSYGLAGGALMANTKFDNTVQAHFQASVRNAGSDEWFHTLEAQKKLGNGYYTIPVFAIAWAAGSLLEDDPIADNVGEWGERSIRSILVGAPPMLATQYIVGGSRPGESTAGSDWKLFQDHNGVSGHSFMGAIPFLTAAQMAEVSWVKFALYAGSTLVPLSRINDDDHYASQAFLGWWFALLATKAIDSTQRGHTNWTFAPWLEPGTSGFAVEYRF